MKNKKLKNQQVLYVKMFGDFSLKYQGRSLIAKKKKETQFALVLQLIFHSGEEGISREHLEKLGRHVSKAAPYEEGELLVIEALTGMGRTEQIESLYVETMEKYRQVYMEEELCKLKDFRRKIEEQLDHPYDILDNIQENMTEQLEKVQEPYQCNWMVFREIYHMVARMIERSGQQVQLMLCTLTDMEEHPIRSDECAEVLSRYIWESICRSIRAGDVVTRYGKGQYLVLLINTKPEDCQEIQKRIDAQFRKKDTVYEIRYSVKSVRSLNNAKDDQGLS